MFNGVVVIWNAVGCTKKNYQPGLRGKALNSNFGCAVKAGDAAVVPFSINIGGEQIDSSAMASQDQVAKGPRNLLRHFVLDDDYPIYGDGSTAINDAPTKGKFYARLKHGGSHAEITLYAAQSDILPQRDEFLAAGSFYWVKQRDATVSPDTVAIGVRELVAGQLIERRTLRYGDDYSFDYMQGALLLERLVLFTTGSGGPPHSGTLGGNKVYAVAQYEYIPVADDVDGCVYGGYGQHWINAKVRVGVTSMNGGANQRALDAGLKIRQSDKAFLEAELANSKGPGFGRSCLLDGGLTVEGLPSTGQRNKSAMAYRVRIEHRPNDDQMFYGFGQSPVSRLGDIRHNGCIGVSTELKFTERIELDAEEFYWGTRI